MRNACGAAQVAVRQVTGTALALPTLTMPIRDRIVSGLTAVMCSLLLIPATTGTALAQQQATTSTEQAAAIPAAQLDSLVAPIALYPDPLLAQVLAASTYPLELVQLQQWLAQHKDLKDQALIDAVGQQDWDPSVQGMAALPDVVTMLTQDIKWTTDLGNAFLAQQSDVMDAVQRMRSKAKGAGKLASNQQVKVETKVVEDKTVVVIEQADPQVIYVPSYDPTVVYGAPAYPAYPYPMVGTGYWAGRALSFGVGVAIGAAFHGGWGYGCGWGGGNNININNNNNFVKNSANRPGGQPGGGGRGGQWQHNPQHRGGAPYGNRETAGRFGGTTRDASAAQRQAGARQQLGGGQQAGGRGGAGGARAQQLPAGGGRGGAAAGGGGSNRVGNRSVAPSTASRGSSAFGGGGGGGRSSYSGGGARSSSSRGGSSMGSRGGGGGRGGGGRGGRR